MGKQGDPIIILLAEDDADDRSLVRRALQKAHLDCDLRFVEDGEELLDYLQFRGNYAVPASAPQPHLVLLDLNMPRKDGRAALAEIRADPTINHIPVIALTTSDVDEDILRTYQLGANSYITKPVTFQGLVTALAGLGKYWFEIVKLPPKSLF